MSKIDIHPVDPNQVLSAGVIRDGGSHVMSFRCKRKGCDKVHDAILKYDLRSRKYIYCTYDGQKITKHQLLNIFESAKSRKNMDASISKLKDSISDDLICNCGKPVRYTMTKDGDTFSSCNKYMKCPTYNELLDRIAVLNAEKNELSNDLETLKKAIKLLS